MNEDYLDNNGYPTEAACERISNWPWQDLQGWFEFVHTLWFYPEMWSEIGLDIHVSTGGWSGNEDLIAAMRENWMLWNETWYQHRRGGHYIFKLPKPEPVVAGMVNDHEGETFSPPAEEGAALLRYLDTKR